MNMEKANTEKTRSDIIGQLSEVRSQSTAETMRDDTNCRGDDYAKMIREVDALQLNALHANCNEFDIDVAPGVIFESIAAWSTEVYEDKMKVEIGEKGG